MYSISVWNTNVSRIEYTPLNRIVKLLEFKIEADELFFYFLTWKINRRKQTLHTYKKHDK